MSNFWGGFAKGFEKSYDTSSISKGMITGAEAKKERAGFEEWKQTDRGKEILNELKLTPEVDYDKFVNTTKFEGVADTISSRAFELDKKRRTQRKDELMDYAMGMIERPSESVMGQFSTGIGGINEQGQQQTLGYLPKVAGLEQQREMLERASIGKALGVEGMKGTQPAWGQEQKMASVRSGIERGHVIIGKEFGVPVGFDIKTRIDALRAIELGGFDPSSPYWKEVLAKYPAPKVGEIIERGGAKYKITGIDKDGVPFVEKVK